MEKNISMNELRYQFGLQPLTNMPRTFAPLIPTEGDAQKAVLLHFDMEYINYVCYEDMAHALALRVSSKHLKKFVLLHKNLRFCDLCDVVRRVENGMGLTRAAKDVAISFFHDGELSLEGVQFAYHVFGLRYGVSIQDIESAEL